MGADYPDWGGQYTNRAFYPLFDSAELAVRLGSRVAYDRRGNVIWTYDFSDGYTPFTSSGSPVGWTAALSSAKFEFPAFSYLITSDNTTDGWVQAYRNFAVPQCDKIGLASMYLLGLSYMEVRHQITFFNGSRNYLFDVRLTSAASPKVEVLQSTGLVDVWTQTHQPIGIDYFQFIKLVVDLSTLKFERLTVGDVEIDLTDYSAVDSGATTDRYIRFLAWAVSNDGQAAPLYIDNVIFTANEPANSW